MIELIREVGGILKELPDMALYILVGLLFYKVFIIGSSFALAKFGITKLHDYLINKPEKLSVTKFSLDKHFIIHNGTPDMFMELVRKMKNLSHNTASNYVHESDVYYVIEAIQKKKEREKKNEVS